MEKEIVGKRKAFMKHSAEYYIEHLEMEPHVEGGYFKECLLEKEDRDLWSSIYFMLAKGEVSHFHRLKSDEVWYYHDGNALTIYMIDEEGKLTAAKLGLDLEKGEVPQVLVPKGMIFGSAMEEEASAWWDVWCHPVLNMKSLNCLIGKNCWKNTRNTGK